ncbi:hypothetical protein A8990_11064 [Paenibacillus taihuensis]|uniref:Uncharacterized protein n=1 Tax=Paenibacillus taihuensis TaxID=1156355 RepID=A0A3D9S360_9BACL|nr:hypothetical protein [Paenibacillus taihuensis]REE86455.1 hypothetical protein A8990_11064 [Paenibacillus taihuensis]
MQTITCEHCGKVNGHGEVGRSWICEDCRVDERGFVSPEEPAEEEQTPPPVSE